MKYLQLFFSIVFLAFMFSCSDPCDDVNCGDNGTCDDGTCLCETGYVGTLCDGKIIDLYTGNWVSDNFLCDGQGQDPVTLVIEEGDSVTEIQFYDPLEPEFIYNVTYVDSTLMVPSQLVNGVRISGTGTINSDGTMNLTFDLLAVAEGESFTCTGLFSK